MQPERSGPCQLSRLAVWNPTPSHQPVGQVSMHNMLCRLLQATPKGQHCQCQIQPVHMILCQFHSISTLTINFPKTHLNIIPQLDCSSKWPLYKHLASAPEVCTNFLYCQSVTHLHRNLTMIALSPMFPKKIFLFKFLTFLLQILVSLKCCLLYFKKL